MSVAVFAMKPASRGSVRLNSSDPRAPQDRPGFLSDPADAAVLAEGVESLRRLAAETPSGATPGGSAPGPSRCDHARTGAVRGFFHPVGTCAIGRVVAGRRRRLRNRRLVVADASVMPTIPRANTNLSTLALAERLAADIAGL